jgi:hypothetical protein
MITPEQLKSNRSEYLKAEMRKIEERIILVNNEGGGTACTWNCSRRINKQEASNIAAELQEVGYKVRLSSGADDGIPYNTLYIIWS